jgi:glycosyltransferase involved in cell wall biosynthesis
VRAVVGIALLTLVPGVSGGSETYARALVETLPRVGEHEYRIIEPERVARSAPGRLADMARGLLRRERGLSVLHYPLSVPVPRSASPTVATIHDLQHVDLPHLFSRAERAFRGVAYHGAARRAALVVVPSEFVRGRVVEALGIDERRVRAIPHGIDHDRFRPGGDAREPFLLYPARPWPHKNHARLFDAFALLRRDRPELRLVLTGAGSYGALPPGVEPRGHVSADELAGLYRHAAAVVFPSLYEGFGQPPLEAMACGCPVACSDLPSLREVCGDAAVYLDPHSPDSIAAAALAAIGSDGAAGIARAAEFTWDASARAHARVYADAATK